MGKRKKKNNNTQQQKPKEPLTLPVDAGAGFSAEEWQHIIANAMVQAEEIKCRKKQTPNEELQLERNFKWYQSLWYSIKSFFCMLFISPEKVKGTKISFALLNVSIQLMFALCSLFLHLLSLFLLAFCVAQLFPNTDVIRLKPFQIFVHLFFTFVTFAFARFFRIARYEAEHATDKDYLFGMFASITSLVSLIVALISLLK